MNAAMPQKPRRADLNPFDIAMAVAAPPALPMVGYAGCCNAPHGRPEVAAEYGCVDWYKYPNPADEDVAPR